MPPLELIQTCAAYSVQGGSNWVCSVAQLHLVFAVERLLLGICRKIHNNESMKDSNGCCMIDLIVVRRKRKGKFLFL